MDLSKIKQFVKQNGDKFIVMENDEPEIVVMSFEEYVKLVGLKETPGKIIIKAKEPKVSVELGESLAETEFMAPVTPETPIFSRRSEDIRLEDLPL